MLVDAEDLGLQELTDDAVQRLYQTVYFLHRAPEKVRCVIQEIMEWLKPLEAQHDRRPETPEPVRARAESLVELVQHSFFEVSIQRWERDLEQWARQKTPAAQPDAPTLLTQYLAHLAWHGIRHYQSIYTAVSEGCLLYRYSPLQVCTVFALAADNRGRVKRRLQRWLGGSFQHVALIRDGAFVTRPPTAWERKRVQQALTLFTPWGSDCISPDVFGSLALPLGFDTLSEHDRKHALMHPTCAGIERLVYEWNRQCPEERLDDPDTTLEVPMFTNSRPPAPEDFDEDSPRPLSDRELRELRGQMAYWLQRAQGRRRANAFHRIRVCVDGQERLHFAPGARALPFMVPLSAIRIQVFGQDAEGELPLAIFYLPDLEEAGDKQRFYAVLEGGATIELVLSPVPADTGEIREFLLQLTYQAARQLDVGRLQCPRLPALVFYLAGASCHEPATHAHLEDGACLRCQRLLLAPWLHTLAEVVQAGQRTQAQVQAMVAAAVAAFTLLPACVGGFDPTPRPLFRMRAVHPDGLLTVTLRETDQGALVVHVETPNPEQSGQTVHVEVIGEGELFPAEVVLEPQGEYGCAGRHTFGSFAELAPRLGAHCAILAALTEGQPSPLPDAPPALDTTFAMPGVRLSLRRRDAASLEVTVTGRFTIVTGNSRGVRWPSVAC